MDRVFTYGELQRMPIGQLQLLRREAEQALGRAAPNSRERMQAAASLDAICRTIRQRHSPRPGF